MNKALYHASFHLMEASKHLSNEESFREEAVQLMEMAKEMASIIQPEEEKVAEEKMLSIIDEILSIGDVKQ